MPIETLTLTNVHAVNRFYNSSEAHGRQACRPRWALIFRYEGRTLYRSGGHTLLSDPEHVILLPRGSAYQWQCTEGGHVVSMEFECDLTGQTALCIPVTEARLVHERFDALEHTFALHRPRPAVLRDAYALLALFASGDYLPSTQQARLCEAADYMALHLDRTVTNAELAALVDLSEVYFRKLFTRHFGCPPIAYHQQLRIRKACQLLEGDAGSISDIAAALGYPNIYDFSRAFKKRVGVSPSHYREKEGRL